MLLFLQEYEKKIVPWLWSFAIFTVWRFLALLFFAIVNDLYFAYNILMTFFWSVFVLISIYGWCAVYSLYLELADLTKLEDLAYLRVKYFINSSIISLIVSINSWILIFFLTRWELWPHFMLLLQILWQVLVQLHLIVRFLQCRSVKNINT